MRELRWAIPLVLVCLPLILLVAGVRFPWQTSVAPSAKPMPVYPGDAELAWIHTTTNAATWERFVTGLVRVQMQQPDLRFDDSRAFLSSTTAVPELVVWRAGQPGRLFIRWYKLQSAVSTNDWVNALRERNPAPLAIIGGGSTDRALDLARAMEADTTWQGDTPPLLITTATADFADDPSPTPRRVVDLYPGKTFRFCFTNGQMAEAVIDFTLSQPRWKLDTTDPAKPDRLPVMTATWTDDRYSVDLQERFSEAVEAMLPLEEQRLFAGQWGIPYSIGGFITPNIFEQQTSRSMAQVLAELPDEKVLLVLPAVAQPAKRLLRALVQANPVAARKLVVVTGDGIPLNTVYRDGEFAWPVSALPVPVVLFLHNNPIAWDTQQNSVNPPAGYALRSPNGTEEEMHFNELGQRLFATCLPPGQPILTRGQLLMERLQADRSFFDEHGERQRGTGEYVVVVDPRSTLPKLTVFRRNAKGQWLEQEAITLQSGTLAERETMP